MTALGEVLYFDARAAEPVKPSLNWRTDIFPAMTSLVWIWKGRLNVAEDEEALSRFIDHCYDATFLCGFNCHASVSLVKAEIIAVKGREFYDEMAVGEALDKRKRIDLMLCTKKWVDARDMSGELRFPSLEELFSRCFPGQGLVIERQEGRVKALQFCLPRVLLEGLTELRQREYRDKTIKPNISQV